MLFTLTTGLSLSTALALACAPVGRAVARGLALTAALVSAAAGVWAFVAFDGGVEGVAFGGRLEWIPGIGASWEAGVDGVSVVLVLLAGVAGVAGVLMAWETDVAPRWFFSLFHLLMAGVYGVFESRDLLMFFLFYELAIVPKYFLILGWGGADRARAAMRLALYSLAGGALVLVGVVAIPVLAGGAGMGLDALAAVGIPAGAQAWLFPLMFTGFAVLGGMWPLHTWAPAGHVAAPTSASMLLAGVVMKLGSYGCLAVAMRLMPEGAVRWAPVIAALGAVGIVYGALAALAQRDFKYMIGYSSVSHMGLVFLGLGTMTGTGLAGAAFQMLSHGLLAGVLFALVGRVVYERFKTREFGRMDRIAERMPFAWRAFALGGLASAGMPGFSGFLAEIQVVAGAWRASPWLVAAAVLGIVVTFGYILRAMRKGFWHQPPDPDPAPVRVVRATWPERFGIGLLLGCSALFGLWPAPVLDRLRLGLAPILEGLASVGGRL